MIKNIGTLERSLRIVVGLALIALTAAGTIDSWGLIGFVPLGTCLLGWFPAYTLLDIKTSKVT